MFSPHVPAMYITHGLLAFMLYKSGITSGPREQGMKKGSNCEGEQESSRTTLLSYLGRNLDRGESRVGVN